MNNLLKFGLLLSPIIHLLFLKVGIRHVSAMWAISLIFVAVLLGLAKTSQTRFNWFWLWAFVSSMFIYNQEIGNMVYLLHISTFFLFYYAIAISNVDWKNIAKPLGILCVIISLFSILEIMGLRELSYRYFKTSGLLLNPTNSAMYIAATAPFLLLQKRGSLCLIVPIIATLMLNSASSVLGIFAMIIAVLLIKRHYLYLALTMLIAAVGSIIGHDYLIRLFDQSSGKLYVWNLATKDWAQHTWVGIGLSALERRYVYNGTAWRFLHNEYLYVACALGLIGLILLCYFLMPIAKAAWKYRNYLCIPIGSTISIMVMAVFSIPLRIYPIVLLMAFNLAILTRSQNET